MKPSFEPLNTERVHGAMTVNETVQLFPDTLPVFNAAGIDSCCGGAKRLDDVAQRHNLDLDELLAALNRAAAVGTR